MITRRSERLSRKFKRSWIKGGIRERRETLVAGRAHLESPGISSPTTLPRALPSRPSTRCARSGSFPSLPSIHRRRCARAGAHRGKPRCFRAVVGSESHDNPVMGTGFPSAIANRTAIPGRNRNGPGPLQGAHPQCGGRRRQTKKAHPLSENVNSLMVPSPGSPRIRPSRRWPWRASRLLARLGCD